MGRWTLLLLIAGVGCRRGIIPPPLSNSEYEDVAAGGKLNVTVPTLRNGGYLAHLNSAAEQAAPDLIGFQVSHYAVEGRAKGRVHLKFLSAEISRDGKISTQKNAPELPFALPEKDRYIRLIYFVRSSQADHNMAIAASHDWEALNGFTKQLKTDPNICAGAGGVSCVWVPAGVAVRTSE